MSALVSTVIVVDANRDASGSGMGIRARRFALYAEDGVVRQLFVEARGEFKVSSADYVLEHLD